MRIKNLVAVVAIAALGFTAAACGDDDGGGSDVKVVKDPEFKAGTTMDRLAKAGTVNVGTKIDQPGFGMNNLEGEPEGFDVEISKIIAGQLGIEPENINWVETQSAVREEYLEQGKVDFITATYTINDKRKERVDFAGPYYEAGQAIMVSKDDDSITGPESFRAGDKTVCSVTGSTPAENIKQYLANEAQQLVLFDTYDKCRDALQNGQVDAVTTDNVILLGFIAQDEDAFKLTGDTFTTEPYGIGVKKGDTEFRNFLNDVLEEAAESDAYKQAWENTAGKFDPNAPELPTINRY